MQLQGGNNPGYIAEVDAKGRLEAHAAIHTDQSEAALIGEAFNLNTGNITLTNAVDTPLFYIKNVGEDKDLIISRIFVYSSTSTGGTGIVNTRVVYNPTSGTLLTATELSLSNFNAGSGNTISVDARLGATGLTTSGGTVSIGSLYASAPISALITFDSIVLPRGASLVFYLQPPAGNTNMVVQAGLNCYLEPHKS